MISQFTSIYDLLKLSKSQPSYWLALLVSNCQSTCPILHAALKETILQPYNYNIILYVLFFIISTCVHERSKNFISNSYIFR